MFDFKDLDSETRKYMIEAIEEAENSGNIYFSTRFNQDGKNEWINLLKEAANSHNEHWLAFQLESRKLMTDFETAATPSGGYTVKHTPHTQAETLAEGQFNRFYILALCKKAKSDGVDELEVYRAKKSQSPRGESEAFIGTKLPVSDIEGQLKVVKDSFKSKLVKPNSGISVKF